MTIGSLFSGIGGLELGLEWAGLGPTIWQVENNEKLHGVLETHWPNAERFTDIRDVGQHNLKPVDLVCGGFPCQDVSSAGKRVGLSGSRSSLWYEMARVIKELRPQWVIVENVASGAKKWTDEIRCDLGELGYATIPIPIAAKDCGAWHERKRIFVVAYLNRDSKSNVTVNAEVAETSESPITDPDGEPIRKQPKQTKWTEREEATEPEYSSIPRTTSNTKSERHERPMSIRTEERQSGFGGHFGRASEPILLRGVHGIPNRSHRIRALGNSVVPQQAQVIGEVINLLRE